jgi:hypothetical protein
VTAAWISQQEVIARLVASSVGRAQTQLKSSA